MRLLSTSFIILIFFMGCSAQKGIAPPDEATSQNITKLTDSTLVISFEQTACYGSCPVHKIEILHNGSATYHGERNVAQIGDYYATVSSTDIQTVYAKAEELGFFSLKPEYTSNITDLPTTLITITSPTKSHSVKAYGPIPQKLQDFIAFLGNHYQKVVWTKK